MMITIPKSPTSSKALTQDFLETVLAQEYGEPTKLASFQIRDANAGVLSHVVIVEVEYATKSKEKAEDELHHKFVAKFLKPEFPLEHMFQVESRFYRKIAPKETFSFQTPRPVYTSSSMIMVEYIASDQTFTAVEGCPKAIVIPLIQKLGVFHAKYMNVSSPEALSQQCQGLASPAGVGSTLSGLAKETQFPGLWEDFLTKIPSLPDSIRNQVQQICQQLATRRLSNIHTAIHDHPFQTIIHGDFHVANMLFRQDQVWLVDWATCGKGFPLLDLVFFAIVSLTTSVRNEVEPDMLLAYYQALGSPSLVISFEEMKKFYRLCILNQFIILVCYDRLSREIVHHAKQPEELSHHFDVVNARACHALIDNFGEDLLPRLKTKEEAAMAPQGECTL